MIISDVITFRLIVIKTKCCIWVIQCRLTHFFPTPITISIKLICMLRGLREKLSNARSELIWLLQSKLKIARVSKEIGTLEPKIGCNSEII